MRKYGAYGHIIWVTGDKREMNLRDMTKTHLIHAHDFVGREKHYGSANMVKFNKTSWRTAFRDEIAFRDNGGKKGSWDYSHIDSTSIDSYEIY